MAEEVERHNLTHPHGQVSCALKYVEFLNKDEFSGGPCETEEELVELLQKHRLLSAAIHWASYCNNILASSLSDRDDVRESVIKFLDTSNCRLALQVLLYTRDQHRHPVSGIWYESYQWLTSLPSLHVATYLTLVQALRTMLESGEHDVTRRDSRGSTALHEAAKVGSMDAVRILLKADASMAHALDGEYRKPFFYTFNRWNVRTHIKPWHQDTFMALFEADANPRWLTGERSLRNLDVDNVISEYCKRKMADALSPDDDYQMEHVRSIALSLAIKDRLPDVAALLVRAGADIEHAFENTRPLYAAVRSNQLDVAADLILAGADPFRKDYRRFPVLHALFQWCRPQNLRCEPGRTVLDAVAAEINCVEWTGRTALFTALERNDEADVLEAIALLSELGLDFEKMDSDGRHIIYHAARRRHLRALFDLCHRSQRQGMPLPPSVDRDDYNPQSRGIVHEEIYTALEIQEQDETRGCTLYEALLMAVPMEVRKTKERGYRKFTATRW